MQDHIYARDLAVILLCICCISGYTILHQHRTSAHFRDLVYATQINAAAPHGTGVLPSIKVFVSTRFYDENTQIVVFPR